MTEIYHKEHLLDRAAMVAMRTMVALHPTPDLGPGGRAAFDELIGRTPHADGVSYELADLGGVPGWWCRPTDAARDAAILYLHGGGYVVGSALAYRNLAGQVAARSKVSTFVADYRLAPEHPFPAAVNDADAVYRGLSAAGVTKIAIVGDSAGGGMALVTAMRMTAARDGSVSRPLAVVALSPWADLALSGNSMTTRSEHDPLLTHAALAQARDIYLGKTDPRDPQASPLYGEFTGLPPVMLHVGEDEVLLDDARRIADRIQAAGSVAELHIWQGMVHVFSANLALLKASVEALDIVATFLRVTLRG